MAIAEVAGAGA